MYPSPEVFFYGVMVLEVVVCFGEGELAGEAEHFFTGAEGLFTSKAKVGENQ